jgi:hypothetical protein
MMGQSRPALNISCNNEIATVIDWHGTADETAIASDRNDRAEAVSASDTNGQANINFFWLKDRGLLGYQSWLRREQNKLKKESRHSHVPLPEICSMLKRGRAIRGRTKGGDVVGDIVEPGIIQGMTRVTELGVR